MTIHIMHDNDLAGLIEWIDSVSRVPGVTGSAAAYGVARRLKTSMVDWRRELEAARNRCDVATVARKMYPWVER